LTRVKLLPLRIFLSLSARKFLPAKAKLPSQQMYSFDARIVAQTYPAELGKSVPEKYIRQYFRSLLPSKHNQRRLIFEIREKET
jgi:hypothetical protein